VVELAEMPVNDFSFLVNENQVLGEDDNKAKTSPLVRIYFCVEDSFKFRDFSDNMLKIYIA
jgi:hypothetical protein